MIPVWTHCIYTSFVYMQCIMAVFCFSFTCRENDVINIIISVQTVHVCAFACILLICKHTALQVLDFEVCLWIFSLYTICKQSSVNHFFAWTCKYVSMYMYIYMNVIVWGNMAGCLDM